jgi:hypothetical protein
VRRKVPPRPVCFVPPMVAQPPAVARWIA